MGLAGYQVTGWKEAGEAAIEAYAHVRGERAFPRSGAITSRVHQRTSRPSRFQAVFNLLSNTAKFTEQGRQRCESRRPTRRRFPSQ